MKRTKGYIDLAKNYLLEKHKKKIAIKEKERDEIISILSDLSQIWEKYEIERVYLYGSVAELSFNNYSDIDIAIEPNLDFEILLRLYCEINRYFKREVDIRLLSKLPFSEKIKREGIVLYEGTNCYFKKRD